MYGEKCASSIENVKYVCGNNPMRHTGEEETYVPGEREQEESGRDRELQCSLLINSEYHSMRKISIWKIILLKAFSMITTLCARLKTIVVCVYDSAGVLTLALYLSIIRIDKANEFLGCCGPDLDIDNRALARTGVSSNFSLIHSPYIMLENLW